jgi:hypothetical protein
MFKIMDSNTLGLVENINKQTLQCTIHHGSHKTGGDEFATEQEARAMAARLSKRHKKEFEVLEY